MKKAVTAVCATLLVGVSLFTYASAVDRDIGPPPTPVVATAPQTHSISALERGRRAVCEIAMPDFGGFGSAVVVSRVRTETGYRYRAVTVHHVYEVYQQTIEDNPDVPRTARLTFVTDFHKPFRSISVSELIPDHILPAFDWASFTFETTEFIECADVATQEDFEAIQAFDPIFAVGAGGPYAPWIKEGLLSATNNVATAPYQNMSDRPWNQQPESFFRMTAPIWWGDSGGAVFTRDGKLIGLMAGFGFGNSSTPALHSGVCVKMHTIRKIASLSNDFFKVEN